MDDDTWTGILIAYLERGRRAVAGAVEGVGEYDLRRPLTPSGTNLLGVVKHLATVEHGYLVALAGRTSSVDELITWNDEPSLLSNADLWVEHDMSSDEVFSLYAEVGEASVRSLRELDLATPVTVPWWSADRRDTTLGLLAVHMITETAQHAGHLQILREQLDGATAEAPHEDRDTEWWQAYVDKISSEAEHFA